MDMGWMFGAIWRFVVEWEKSVARYPNIETGQEFEGYPPVDGDGKITQYEHHHAPA
jgi:hypothetical protein